MVQPSVGIVGVTACQHHPELACVFVGNGDQQFSKRHAGDQIVADCGCSYGVSRFVRGRSRLAQALAVSLQLQRCDLRHFHDD